MIPTVRAWLHTLSGWIEPDILVQRRLAEEIPAVAAARSRLVGEIEAVIAAALADELDAGPLAPRLVASALGAALLDAAVAFVTGGLERLR